MLLKRLIIFFLSNIKKLEKKVEQQISPLNDLLYRLNDIISRLNVIFVVLIAILIFLF